ncbi:hypothetical protein Cantr_08817 [Candida viswanathii]|uniref:Uncharacterized protein n=1 Tax=Candida viswanathii TaxID=5486 RepID=A0A367Y9U7_9ASCO|nr:hypothetical protein Cantr_08817 [Candida viswanathii]
MSLDYISDSEHEESQLKLTINQELLSNQLLQLSPTKRDAARRRLEELTNLSYTNTEMKQHTAVELSTDDRLPSRDSDIIEDSDDSDMDAVDLIRRLPVRELTTDTSAEPPLETTSGATTTHDDQENENHLRSYLNTTNSYITMSGRSLRKRNFASTHPYLADQAHYLGLSDLNYLNEIYEENQQDLENVVRYLNYNYVKLKERYPKDEKYKSKNFYTIISRQSHIAQEKERQEETETNEAGGKQDHNTNSDPDGDDEEEDEGNKEFTLNDYNSQAYETDESSNEPEDLLDLLKRHHPMIVEDEDSESSESDSAQSEAYVRVGGKLRKEKNALRGVLPESAKRLSIYTSARKQKRQQKRLESLEHRKGVAVRKTISKKRARKREDFSGFVDDNITYDTNNELYHELYEQPVEVEPYVAPTYPGFEDIDPFSDTSQSESEALDHESVLEMFGTAREERPGVFNDIGEVSDVELLPDIIELPDVLEMDNDHQDPGDVFDFEVREGDYINHMLATTTKSKLKGKKRQRVDKSTLPSVRRSYGTSGSTSGTPRTPRSSSGTPRISTGALQYKSRKPKTRDLTHYLESMSTRKKSRSRRTRDDSYSRLPVKKIAAPKETHQVKKSKASKVKKSTEKPRVFDNQYTKRTRDLFANDYLFLRTPVLSTTIFEAESKTRFVNNNRSVNPSAPQMAPSLLLGSQPIFDHGCMLNDINVKKITDLGTGKFYQMNKDSVTITSLGDPVVLTLVDIEGSLVRYEKALTRLARMLKNGSLSVDSFVNTFYSSIKGFLEWNLILQRTPSQRQWKLVQLLISNTLHSTLLTSSQIKFIIPYCLLLQYTMNMIARLNESTSAFDLPQTGVRYWQLFFETFTVASFDQINFEVGAKLKDAESFFIMCSLLESEKKWWSTVSNAIELYDPMDIGVLLEAVQCLCVFSRKHFSWDPLQLVYQKADAFADPEFYYRYLEIVYLMNQRKNWPLDERIVLQVYSSITQRKFANFPDEIGMPELMGRVSTRLDIPGETFFEQFMQLLYWYVSGLSEPSKVKRLVTKLFTTSSFSYANDQEHHIMFINRLNFILLLALVSTVDLKTQLTNVLTPIQQVNDMKLLKLSAKAVYTLTEIAMSRKSKLPVEGISMVVKCCIANYYTGSGVLKVWQKFLSSTRQLFKDASECLPQLAQFLTLPKAIDNSNIPDRISTDLCQVYSAISSSLVKMKESVMPAFRKSIEVLDEFIAAFLHKQMGRIPLPSVNEENKVVYLVEILIAVWIQCTFLLNGNWERLVLQTFPYTGNHQLRERFVLYFYSNILKYYDLKGCQEIVVRTVLKDLVRFSPSGYLSGLMRKLGKDRWDPFVFPKHEDVTLWKIENSRHTVVSAIIKNITNSHKCTKLEQQLYIKEILTTLNAEFEKYYSSTKYKTFCINVVKEIQKQCDPDMVDESTVYNLASRVGILDNEWTQFKIQKLPLKQKLQTFAIEFHNALYFGGDSISVLEKFTYGDGVELIYHLVSIYSQEILLGRCTTWRIVHALLDFFDRHIRDFKFRILNFNFKRFLRLLMELPMIMCPSTVSDQFFRISTMRSIGSILNFCRTLFNGYNDGQEIEEMWSSFKQTSRQERYDSQSLTCPYSSFRLLDIIGDGRFSNEPAFEDINQDTLDIAKRMLISETFLIRTHMVDSENRLLDYDFTM